MCGSVQRVPGTATTGARFLVSGISDAAQASLIQQLALVADQGDLSTQVEQDLPGAPIGGDRCEGPVEPGAEHRADVHSRHLAAIHPGEN